MLQTISNLTPFLSSENNTTTIFFVDSLNKMSIEDLKTLTEYSKEKEEILRLSFSDTASDSSLTLENILFLLEDSNLSFFEPENYNVHINFNKKKIFESTQIQEVNDSNFFVFFDLDKAIEEIYSTDIAFSMRTKFKLLILDMTSSISFSNAYFVIKNISTTSFNEMASQNYPISESIINDFKAKEIFLEDRNSTSPNKTPYFWVTPQNNDIEASLQKKFYYNALLCFFNIISDKIISDNTFLIRGNFNLEFTIDKNIEDLNFNDLFDLLDFVSDEKSEDKILILRNVLTTYLTKNSNSNNFCSQLDGINSSLKHHYSMFIQEELKIFLEQKQQVITEANNLARTVSNYTSTVTANLKTNIFSFILALITGSIPDLVEKVDNNFVLLVIAFLMLGYLIISIFNLHSQESLVNSAINSFENSLKYIASNSIEGLKFEELEKNFFSQERKIFINTLLTALIAYLVLIAINITIIIKLM